MEERRPEAPIRAANPRRIVRMFVVICLTQPQGPGSHSDPGAGKANQQRIGSFPTQGAGSSGQFRIRGLAQRKSNQEDNDRGGGAVVSCMEVPFEQQRMHHKFDVAGTSASCGGEMRQLTVQL